MKEYGIYNAKTNAREIIFGYNFANACVRAKLNPNEWEIEYQEFVD